MPSLVRFKKQLLSKKTHVFAAVAILAVVLGQLSASVGDGASAHAHGAESVADVVARVLPSVVNISSRKRVGYSRNPYRHPLFRQQRRHASSLGSGVIVDAKGIILTNNHVVDKADRIWVMLWDKRRLSAKVIGTDPKSDLAVLQLINPPKDLRAIPIGKSSLMRLGDSVLAIGNPFGVGQTVTRGIVSAKGRANVGIVDYEDFIQTDAAINPGNSGGALVNRHGELIGINTAILSRSGGYQGIGFAIPSDMARPIMQSLIKHGKVVRGWLGVMIQELTPEIAQAMKIGGTRGVLISDVDPAGPAKKAGLRRDDVVLKINGKPTRSTARLRNLIAAAGAHAKVSLQLLRNGAAKMITVKLGKLGSPRAGRWQRTSFTNSSIRVAPLSPASRRRYRIPRRLNHGVLVDGVKPNSSAAWAGLKSGDVILSVDRVKIRTVREFNTQFSAARDRVLLLIYRNGYTNYLIIPK